MAELLKSYNREEIKQGLEAFPREKILEFTWRCAFRALPFFGAEGDFYFCEKGPRQTFITTFFRAVDGLVLSYLEPEKAEGMIPALLVEIERAYSGFSSSLSASASVAACAFLSGYKASTASTLVDSALAASGSSISLINVAGLYGLRTEMELIVLGDFVYLQGEPENLDFVDQYGHLLQKFYDALELEGGHYWASVYKGVVENGLHVDVKAAEQRVNVPREIQALGAAEMGNYLEKLEQQNG